MFKQKKLLVGIVVTSALLGIGFNGNVAEAQAGEEEVLQATDSTIVKGTWGTAPVEYDTSTATLTVFAGEISKRYIRFSDGNSISTDDIKHIKFQEGVIAPTDSSGLFTSRYLDEPGWRNLESIEGNLDTSNVTNMLYMFCLTDKLKTLDVSNWDTSNVTDMNSMFEEASSLTTLDVSNWDTSNVTDMNSMFEEASSLTTLNVSNWDTSNVTDMVAMFALASSLTTLNVSNWDTSNVQNMVAMFALASSLTTLDVSNWDTSNVQYMGWMFKDASSLTNLDVSNWDTSSIAYDNPIPEEIGMELTMNQMFEGTNLQSITLGPASIFDHTTGLPLIVETEEYTGAWERIEPESPMSLYMNSDEFMINYDGTKPGTYVRQKNRTNLEVKDTTLIIGDTWQAEDNVLSATDKYGLDVPVTELTVDGTVDTNKLGDYEVTYHYGPFTKTAKITVVENQTNINVKDTTIVVGDTWQAEDNFLSAIDKYGVDVPFAELTVEGTVDTSKAGSYEITYRYGSFTKIAKITVTAKEVSKQPESPVTPPKEGAVELAGKEASSAITNHSVNESYNLSENKQTYSLSQTKNEASASKESDKRLPSTGEKVGILSVLIGIVLLSSATIIYTKRKENY
ncbi:BspA family leucine-rich repeat surface protein [Staphylococcus aureus]|nr:BspA family leucine-rich repeat surface protein [Staphylococcus aureus]